MKSKNKLKKICTLKILYLLLSHNLKAIHNKDYSVVKTFKGALSLLVIGFFLFLEYRRKSDGADDSDKADSERVMVRRFYEMMI